MLSKKFDKLVLLKLVGNLFSLLNLVNLRVKVASVRIEKVITIVTWERT